MKLLSATLCLWVSVTALACTVEPSRPDASGSTGGTTSIVPDAGPSSGGAAGASGGAAGASGGAAGESGGAAGAPSGGGTGGGSEDAGPDAALAPACSELDPRTVPAEVAVLPDAGEAPFVNVLAGAKTSIDVMIYQMGYGGVLDTITAKAKAGVKVRVILDLAQKSVNQKYSDVLVAAGAQVEWSDPDFTYMHAKLILVDGSVAVISTGNYLKSFMLKERNFVVTDRDPWDLANLTALFQADWDQATPTLNCTRLLVSPVNAKQRILALINGATKSLVIESMQLGDTSVRSAVAARKAAGVDVRVLLANPSWIDANQSAATFLASNGIPARWLGAPSVHVKAIVADGARAFTGSENLSYTSLNKNREVGVVLTEAPAVATILSTFEKDWAAATPF